MAQVQAQGVVVVVAAVAKPWKCIEMCWTLLGSHVTIMVLSSHLVDACDFVLEL
jgi:hypothetical protein